jgi:plastocyanin
MRVMLHMLVVAVLAGCVPLVGWAAPAAAAEHSITISGYAYSPSAITITAGDTVTWTNKDEAPHDVTTTSAPVAIHGATMSTGQSWSYRFTTPGTYSYICSIHPDMKASVTVVAAPTTSRAAPAATRRLPQAQVRTVTAVGSTHTTNKATPRPTRAASSASAPAVVPSVAGTAGGERRLRPLLIVAGIVAAVATLALLLLASRPEDTG